MSDSRLQTKEAARENERYRVLFDLSPTAVYSINAAGVIQDFNRYAAELWGREPAPGDTDERFCGSFKLFRGAKTATTATVRKSDGLLAGFPLVGGLPRFP
jgi:hypothetical protein